MIIMYLEKNGAQCNCSPPSLHDTKYICIWDFSEGRISSWCFPLMYGTSEHTTTTAWPQ